MIGADFLNLVELHSIKGQVTIRKIAQKVSNNLEMPEVLKVNTIEDVDPFDFSYIPEKKNIRQEVEHIAKNYEPRKT